MELLGVSAALLCACCQEINLLDAEICLYTDFLYPQKHFYAQNLQWFWKLLSPFCSHLHVDDVMMHLSIAVVLSHGTGKNVGECVREDEPGEPLRTNTLLRRASHLHPEDADFTWGETAAASPSLALSMDTMDAVFLLVNSSAILVTLPVPTAYTRPWIPWAWVPCAGPTSLVPVQLSAVQNRRLIPVAVRVYVNK